MNFPRLSEKEFTVLDLLRSGVEHYGLEMVKKSNGALKRGTIYVTLERMTEKGLVTSRRENSRKHTGMPRRLYKITGEGQSVLLAVEAYRASFAGGVRHA